MVDFCQRGDTTILMQVIDIAQYILARCRRSSFENSIYGMRELDTLNSSLENSTKLSTFNRLRENKIPQRERLEFAQLLVFQIGKLVTRFPIIRSQSAWFINDGPFPIRHSR